MLARESKRDGKVGRGEHVHWLVNTDGRQDIVERYFEARFTESDYEVDVDLRDQRLVYLRGGKVGDASTYLLKACHQHVWHKNKTIPHRPSGPVYGPRILWSTNINSIQPLHRIDPATPHRPEDTKGSRGAVFDDWLMAEIWPLAPTRKVCHAFRRGV